MKCGYSYDELTAYFDGELPREEQSKLRQHLGCCGECASALEELRFVRSAVLSAWQAEIQAPEDLRSNVLGRLREEGAFRESLPVKTPVATGKGWKGFKGWGAAAAASALLVAGASWAWLAGNVDNAPLNTALIENKPAITEHIPPDKEVKEVTEKEPDGTAGGSATDNQPGDKPGIKNQGTAVTSPEKPGTPRQTDNAPQQTATGAIALKDYTGKAFLSVDKKSYSGYFQLTDNWRNYDSLDQKIKLTAAGYNAALAGSFKDSGGVVTINVPTASYNALYEDLKGLLSAGGIVKGSDTTVESIESQYKVVQTELEKVREEYEASAGDMEKQNQLANRQNSLIDQMEDLEQRARISTIAIKL
ncbi:membrane protein [Desulfocucumis palustris]|uniref:Anti-sigma-W factor RsiW n=1 Tax=Desulfocucumis palustris TaxID=1898651 RepID=A0A2L2XHJ2_9FIRM|nr:zf-HC2 domain-containing protein [Desulfocucumis palustris]GBF35620.1 membrane protein [Desulfocucumis palustris]